MFQTERYITAIDIDKFRSCYAKFRTTNRCLMIEIGRYYNIDKKFRTCAYCDAYVEDVYHFVLKCPLYKNLRDKYISLYYTNNPRT